MSEVSGWQQDIGDMMRAGMLWAMITSMDSMTRAAIGSELQEVLGREPTASELWYYNNQLYWRDLARWWQGKLSSYQKIHDLVWMNS